MGRTPDFGYRVVDIAIHEINRGTMDATGEQPAQKKTLTEGEANDLVLEHRGWAESIARSVARSWNLDWQLDGLDGAAMEALIFCSRRFQPDRAIPFRGYARKRIHEASTEAARRSKGWLKGLGGATSQDRQARDVSIELLNVFPELRNGELPVDEGDPGDTRGSIRQLLVGATLIASRQISEAAQPDEIADHLRVIRLVAKLEAIHQEIMWYIYWEGFSLRALAERWGTDELNVIREHKALLAYLQKALERGKPGGGPKVRPGLKKLGTIGTGVGRFTQLVNGEGRA